MLLMPGAAPHLRELSAEQPMAGCAAGRHLPSSVALLFFVLNDVFVRESLGGRLCARLVWSWGWEHAGRAALGWRAGCSLRVSLRCTQAGGVVSLSLPSQIQLNFSEKGM